MLQVARLAPKQLGDAAPLIETFLAELWNADGGAKDRAGASDLYYTVFTLEGLLALQADVPEDPGTDGVRAYLASFGDGEGLDVVHLGCLARCWACLAPALRPSEEVVVGIEARLRTVLDGALEGGNIYHNFIAYGAYQDLGLKVPDAPRIVEAIESLRSKDGGYSNVPGLSDGVTTVTAAAAVLRRQLGYEVDPVIGQWLLDRVHPAGGFVATPQVTIPDLLSSATALHALAGLKLDLSAAREVTLDFIDTLWTGRGFCGHWADDIVDSEYTYYGLLALGHLSL